MQAMPRYVGKYELISPLGQGGMGAVYKAFHPQLQRFVAIKLLLATAETDPDFIARFHREAMAVARLRHPHIVQVFDFDIQDARPYMVMEFLEGETLAQRLTRVQRSGHVLPVEEVVRIFQQLCSAVEYAHKQEMLHRDLKPQNVIIDAQNDVILTDFGLAKIKGVSGLTNTNAAVGTPYYMSPEQAQGQPVDARSDVYALGVMLYQALTGKVPFDASTPVAVLMQHVTAAPPPISDINPQAPAGLAQIAMIAMSKDPAQRFRTVGAMAQAIAVALDSPTGAAASPGAAADDPASSAEVSDMDTILSASAQAEPGAGAPLPPHPPHAPDEAATLPTNIAPGAKKRRAFPGRYVLIGLIVLLLAATSGALGFVLLHQGKPTAAITSVGTVSFTDSDPQDISHPANVLTATFTGLAQPAGGATYFAWLCDSGAAGCTLLGPVIVDQAGKASLTKTQASNWLGAADAQTTLTIKITQEQTEPSAPPATPSSNVRYSGSLDPAVVLHIHHQLSAFTKAAPFANNMTALDVGFGTDALLLQNLSQLLQVEQNEHDVPGLQRRAGWMLSLIAGNQNGNPGPFAGDDGFGMGTQAPACTIGLTTTYLPLLIEHACYAYQAGGTPALKHLFTLIQQAGTDAAKSLVAIQQMAQAAQQVTDVNQVDVTAIMQQAQKVLDDEYHMLADSEQMATITLYPK